MKNTFDFTIRLYQPKSTSCLDRISNITISNITLVKKDTKYQTPCVVEGNKKKFNYEIEHKPKFYKQGGSYNYPCITFKGKYIDIHVKNFPRYPAYYQDYYAVRNCLSGYGYTNYLNDGFPYKGIQERVEILNLQINTQYEEDWEQYELNL